MTAIGPSSSPSRSPRRKRDTDTGSIRSRSGWWGILLAIWNARAAGARCLLVGTGRYPLKDLQGLGADAVLHDLSDVDSVYALLLNEVAPADRRGSGRG